MIRPSIPVFSVLTSAVATLVLAGCEKPQIRVYTVAKEAATPAPAAAPEPSGASPAPTAERARPRPQLSYNQPAGWAETGASQMSLVNFTIKTDQGQATVNITPLAGMQGNEAAIVNMWRSQVGQPVLNDADVAKGFTTVEVAGSKAGQLFEVAGSNSGKPMQIVTAFDHRDGHTWFFKLQGDESVVATQKPVFLEFLKSVKIKEGEAATTSTNPPPASPAEPATEPGATAAMVAPEGWQSVAPGQMQLAKFAVQTADGAKADVSVSVFPSDTGGTLANVNRWRRQLGMEATDEAGLAECVTPLGDASIDGAPGAILADLTHENRRMLGAIVPRDGKYWFYKMMGDVAAVNAEKENFVHFAKSQP